MFQHTGVLKDIIRYRRDVSKGRRVRSYYRQFNCAVDASIAHLFPGRRQGCVNRCASAEDLCK